jgi:DNA-binding MarR family transcriptional regulator
MRIDNEIKANFRNDFQRLIVNLTYTVNRLNYNFLQHLRKQKLTEQQYNILMVLGSCNSEGPVSLGFLKERMLDKNSDVSRIVEKLFEKGLVSRKENSADRRQKDLGITDTGISLMSDMSYCEKETDKLFQNLTLEEVQQLNYLLDKLRG